MGSLSKFVTGLSIAVIAGMAVNMGVAVAEPPPGIPGSSLMAGVKMEKISAEPIDPDQVDPGIFLADLFGDHFGVRYVPGSSGLSATIAGATVDGQEIPADLIGDYEAAGFQVLRRWNLQVVSGGGVAATSTFTETFRAAAGGPSLSGAALQAHGISSNHKTVVSGYTRNAAGQERELFGIVSDVRLLNGRSMSAFTPLGGADDQAGAIALAEQMVRDIAGQQGQPPVVLLAPPAPIPVPGPGQELTDQQVRDICLERWRTCVRNARANYEACLLNAGAATAACIGACAAGCLASGPGYPLCMSICGASCIAAEVLMMEACRRQCVAAYEACDQAYRDCIRNRAR
jgi:hypothetical protein